MWRSIFSTRSLKANCLQKEKTKRIIRRGESETLKTEKPIRSFILLVDKLVCVFGSKRMREMDSLPASPLLLSRTFPEETYIYNLSDDGCYA